MTLRRTLCAHCKGHLNPERPGQVLHPDCAIPWAEAQYAKKERIEAKRAKALQKIDRRLIRERKQALKTNGQLKAQAQRAVNAYVRARDADKPCISCGGWSSSGVWHAGHFRSRGAAPHLALDPRNIHRQCPSCNLYLHGNLIGYRQGLIERYGDEYVIELESDNIPREYRRDDFVEINREYRQKLKELKVGH